MIIHIVKYIKVNKYIYNVDENKKCYAEANYTFGFLNRKITAVTSNKNETFVLCQTKWLLKLITIIPIFWLMHTEVFPYYNLYYNGMIIGRTKNSFFKSKCVIVICEQNYELYLHSNNYVSIMREDEQIALLKKETRSFNERGLYEVKYEENKLSQIILLLLVTFADVIFFNNHLKLYSIKYEKAVGRDKFYYRTLWNPDK